MKRILLFLTCVLTLFGVARADVTVEITYSSFGNPGGYAFYKTSEINGTAYAANFYGSNKCIQTNKSDNQNGFITTKNTNGEIKSLKFEFTSSQTTSRDFTVYFSNTPYVYTTGTTESLTPSSISGTVSKTYKATTSPVIVDVPNGYKYWAFTNSSGAIYMSTITVVYAEAANVPSDPIAYTALDQYEDEDFTLTEGGNKQLDLGSSHPKINFDVEATPEGCVTITDEGLIEAIAEGHALITATWSADDNFTANDEGIYFMVTVTPKSGEVNPTPGGETLDVTFDFTGDNTNLDNLYGLSPAFSGNTNNSPYVTSNVATSGPVKIVFGPDNNSTTSGPWRVWNDGLRAMGKSSSPLFTVSVENGKVKKVELNTTSSFNVDGYKNNANITTWEGSEDAVIFTCTSSANNPVKTITVYYELNDSPIEPPVVKTPVTLSYDPASVSVNMNESATIPTLTISGEGVNAEDVKEYIEYTVSGTEGLISGTDGVYTANTDIAGTATITASLKENEKFSCEESAIFTLTVTNPNAVAGKVAYVALGYSSNYEGNKYELSGTVVDTDYTINGICTFRMPKTNSSGSNVEGDLVKWYANDVITITPADGVTITGMTMKATASSYAKLDINSDSRWSQNGTTYTWTGNSTDPIQIKNTGQTRFNYLEIEYLSDKEIEMPVQKAKVSLAFDPTTLSVDQNATDVASPVLSIEGTDIDEEAVKAYVSYSVEGDGIVINEGNVITINTQNVGKTVLTATLAENDKFECIQDATFTLIVSDPNATGYVLVTDIAQLGDEAECIIVNTDLTKAMSTTQNPNNRGSVAITENPDGTITPTDDTQIITIAKNGDYYTLNVGNGYLWAAGGTSGNNNYLRTRASLGTDQNDMATIEFNTQNEATIKFQGNAQRSYIRNNGDLFSCYQEGGQTAIKLYMNPVKAPQKDPTPELSFTFEGQTVTEPIELGWNATEFPTLVTPEDAEFVVTYTSSDTTVAEIDEDGNITLKGIVGETVITAETAAIEGQYAAGSVSYTLVILDPNSAKGMFNFNVENPYGMSSTDNSGTYQEGSITANEKDVTLVLNGRFRSWKGTNRFDLRVYSSGTEAGSLTFSVPAGYKLETIEFNTDGTDYTKLSPEVGTIKNGVWEPGEDVVTSVKFTAASNATIYTIDVYYTAYVELFEGTETYEQSGNVNNDQRSITLSSLEDQVRVFIHVPEGSSAVPYYRVVDVEPNVKDPGEGGGQQSGGEDSMGGGEGPYRIRRAAEDWTQADKYDCIGSGDHGKYYALLDNETKGTLEVYFQNEDGSTTPTMNYSFIVNKETPTGVESVVVGEGEVIYFDLNGRRIQNPDKGIFIKVEADKVSKVIL